MSAFEQAQLRILFSEDDPDSLELTRLMLESSGFEVVCSDNPHDVLARARGERFDAYLLDNWMPVLSGIELCRRLREIDPSTPIIFFSGATFPTDKAEAFASGAQDYLTKPATREYLAGAITLAIRNSKAVRSPGRTIP